MIEELKKLPFEEQVKRLTNPDSLKEILFSVNNKQYGEYFEYLSSLDENIDAIYEQLLKEIYIVVEKSIDDNAFLRHLILNLNELDEILTDYISEISDEFITSIITSTNSSEYCSEISDFINCLLPEQLEKHCEEIKRFINANDVGSLCSRFAKNMDILYYFLDKYPEKLVSLDDDTLSKMSREKIKGYIRTGKFDFDFDFDSSLLTSDPEYVRLFLENSNGNRLSGIGQIIDNVDSQYWDYELYLLALEKGYWYSSKSPDIIINNPDYLKAAIEYGVITFYELDKMPQDKFTPEIFKLALEKGYEISDSTPKYVFENFEYLKSFSEIDFVKYLNIIPKEQITNELFELCLKSIYDKKMYNNIDGYYYNDQPLKLLPDNVEKNADLAVALIKYGHFLYVLKEFDNSVLESEKVRLYLEEIFPSCFNSSDSYKEQLVGLEYKLRNYYYIKDNPLSLPFVRTISSIDISNFDIKKFKNNNEFLKEFIKVSIARGNFSNLRFLTDEVVDDDICDFLVGSNLSLDNHIINNIFNSFKLINAALEKLKLNTIDFLDKLSFDKFLLNGIEKQELDVFIIKAIESGYRFNSSSPNYLRQFKYIEKVTESGQADAIDYLDESTLTEDEKGELDNLVNNAIEKGYRFSKDSPNYLKQFKYIEKVTESGQADAIDYLDESTLTEDEKGELDNLVNNAIEKGYRFSKDSPNYLKQFKYIEKVTESGQANAIDYLDESTLIEDEKGELDNLVNKAIEKGYRFSEDSPNYLRQFKYIEKVTESGQADAIEYLNISGANANMYSEIEKLLYLALEKGCNVHKVTGFIIEKLNSGGLGFKFSDDISKKIFDNFELGTIFYLQNYVNNEYKNDEQRAFFSQNERLLKRFGKTNIFEKNPVYSFEFVKYVLPVLGEEISVDLLRYNSGAAQQIIEQIVSGKTDLIINYYNNICSRIFNYSDKTIHYVFRYFDKYQDLIEDIIGKNIQLNEQELEALKNIVYSGNTFNIKSVDELRNYDIIIKDRINQIINSQDIMLIKNFISKLFGYMRFNYMYNDFINFQLDDFHKISFILEKLENSNTPKEKIQECLFTDFDNKLILLMKEIIESQNTIELQELIKDNIVNDQLVDYSIDVSNLINKIRKLYKLQFQTRMSDIASLKSGRSLHSKTITLYKDKYDEVGFDSEVQYEIIDMDSEKFNFLAHRIYNYDPTMTEFCKMLMCNPTLWDKLDGASTLSTSSISDKGFWMLHSEDNSGVIYLFNELTDNFMLFMYKHDLFVEHGGHKLEPTSRNNYFTDLDAFNQMSVGYNYNEVAGFREGMMPCAIACVGDEPNDDQIRAADYFKIPIIRFNMKAYKDQNQENYKTAKENIQTDVSKENIDGIFFSGDILDDDSLEDKYEYCFNILKDKYQNKEISQKEFIGKVSYIQSVLDRISDSFNNQSFLRKVELFIETFCAVQNISEEELIDIQSANMGESGIMYKYKENGKEYLLKPAVDKQELKHQNFRAEVQKSASILQSIISDDTAVAVSVIGDKTKISKQEKIDLGVNKNELNRWANGIGNIDSHHLNQLLQEYVVDFLLCNFDCFDGNFIIDSNNNVRGIDKEQSFRFIDSEEALKPDFSYVPNGMARIPIYKIMFEKYNNGEIDLDFSSFYSTIEKVKQISDEEYKNIFRPYAESLNPRNSEVLLQKILDRKHKCTSIMEEYVSKIQHEREESKNVGSR